MPSSVKSDSSGSSIAECLENLNFLIRDLEAVVFSSSMPLPGFRGHPPHQDHCPHDHPRRTSSPDRRQSVSRGCPYVGQGVSNSCDSVPVRPQTKALESSGATKSSQNLPPELSRSIIKALPKMGEFDVDVIVEDTILVTENQEKVTEKNAKHLYHLRKTNSGEFVPRSVDSPRQQSSLLSSSLCNNSDEINPEADKTCEESQVGSEIEQKLANRVMWEATAEFEQEEFGPGPLRKVKSKESIRAFKVEEPEDFGADDQAVLDTVREVRRRIKCVQDEIKALPILNETPNSN